MSALAFSQLCRMRRPDGETPTLPLIPPKTFGYRSISLLGQVQRHRVSELQLNNIMVNGEHFRPFQGCASTTSSPQTLPFSRWCRRADSRNSRRCSCWEKRHCGTTMSLVHLFYS